MNGLPPGRTEKRGRPKKYRERLSPGDFGLESPKAGDWKAGVRPVPTRLFPCTKDPEGIGLGYKNCADDAIREYGEEDIRYLPLACYMPRWDIEISYYEAKTFWPLEEYRVQSHEGIERLINLECMAYSTMTLLPYSDETFSCYQSASA